MRKERVMGRKGRVVGRRKVDVLWRGRIVRVGKRRRRGSSGSSMSLDKIYGLGPAPYFELTKAHIIVEDVDFFLKWEEGV